MTAALGASGLALLLVSAILPRVARRLPPRETARAATAGLVGGAIVVELALVAAAAPTVLRALGVHALAAACDRVFGRLAWGGPWVGWSAFAAAVALPIVVAVQVRRCRRDRDAFRVEAWVGEHVDCGDHELVILPTEASLAASILGALPQVVVSSALARDLCPKEFEAVVAHELAHLRHRHDRQLVVAAVVERCLGPLGSAVASGLRHALERWADEEAAGADRDRRAAVRSALLTLAAGGPPAAVPAFRGAQAVAERIRALECPPPRASLRARVVTYLPAGVMALGASWALAAWLAEARMMLAMAGYCVS